MVIQTHQLLGKPVMTCWTLLHPQAARFVNQRGQGGEFDQWVHQLAHHANCPQCEYSENKTKVSKEGREVAGSRQQQLQSTNIEI